MVTPALRIDDLFVRPDPATGFLHIQAAVHNSTPQTTRGQMQFSTAPASSGETATLTELDYDFPPGDTTVATTLKIKNPRLWELNDPYLYRVTAQVQARQSDSISECSTRCGFREFRFEDGYFRLNGRRIFLRSSHTVNHYPIGLQFPHDPDLARRDFLNVKVMGFNMVRFIWGGSMRYQLDLCDEIGVMVYQEHYASHQMTAEQPTLGKQFDHSISNVILRDRNHPSIVIWGLLNEISNNPQFQHAVQSLDLVHSLDASRVVFLNSGRYDGQYEIGSICNPGSNNWEPLLGSEGPQNALDGNKDISFEVKIAVEVGETLDFVVGIGLDGCGADTTPVEISISENNNPKTWGITKDISFTKYDAII
jgi:beta-galactosidase/beta-glucuronidase